jgi:hypothetical protein
VFGVALLVAVFTGSGGYASARVFTDGFTAAIAASAALSLLGAAAGFGLPLRRASLPSQRRSEAQLQVGSGA